MADDAFPEDVKQLIIDKIDSVAHLEALLLLRSTPEEWPAERLAQRLYIDEPAAAKILAQLRSNGFLTVREESGSRYRYAPASSQLQGQVDRLADTYRQRLIPVTNLIHNKPARRDVQRFADAFRFRREG